MFLGGGLGSEVRRQTISTSHAPVYGQVVTGGTPALSLTAITCPEPTCGE